MFWGAMIPTSPNMATDISAKRRMRNSKLTQKQKSARNGRKTAAEMEKMSPEELRELECQSRSPDPQGEELSPLADSVDLAKTMEIRARSPMKHPGGWHCSMD